MSYYDEDPSVLSAHSEMEIVINRPVAKVWRQYLDHGSWITSHNIENIYGEPGSLGSVTRVSFKKAKEQGLPEPHYHYCKVITLVLEKRSILRGYTGKNGGYGMHFRAFDDMRFEGSGDQTRLIFNLFMAASGEAVMSDPAAAKLDDSREGMIRNLGNLKRIVESQ